MSLEFNPYSVGPLDLRDAEVNDGIFLRGKRLFIVEFKCLQIFARHRVY